MKVNRESLGLVKLEHTGEALIQRRAQRAHQDGAQCVSLPPLVTVASSS